MNQTSDESQSFDSSDLTIAKPAVSDSLSVELARPEIRDDLTLKQPAIGNDLSQEFAHLLMPPEKNSKHETSR